MAEVETAGPIPFFKMSGSGNDFIIIDNRRGFLRGDLSVLASRVCRRHTSVGADGLIILEESPRADFRWQFFNADGSRAEMCGNGGRCAARLASMEGIAQAEMKFETDAGLIAAAVNGSRVKLQVTRPFGFNDGIDLEIDGSALQTYFVNTGVPHAVIFLEDVETVDVDAVGRRIRHHPQFQPAGTNVDFVTVESRGRLNMRTYERGVEGETEACGTGAAASALVAWMKGMTEERVGVRTTGGEILTIHIVPEDGEEYPKVFLEGGTTFICCGTIDPEGYGKTTNNSIGGAQNV